MITELDNSRFQDRRSSGEIVLQPVFAQQDTFIELFRAEEAVLRARRDNPQAVIPMIDVFQSIPESGLGGHA